MGHDLDTETVADPTPAAPATTAGATTKDEKAAWLKDCVDELENELNAVRERIEEIRA